MTKPIKTILLIGLALFFISCSSDRQNNTHPTGEQKESLNIAIEKFNKAFKDGNIALLETMVTDSYRHTNSSSKAIGKKQWFDYLHRRSKEINDGKLEVIAYEMDEKDIQFYGATALVTARVKVKNVRSGDEKENAFRVTNVWIFESGKWKRAGFHDGKIK